MKLRGLPTNLGIGTLSGKDQMVNILGFAGQRASEVTNSTLQSDLSQWKTAHEQTRDMAVSNKTLFTKTGGSWIWLAGCRLQTPELNSPSSGLLVPSLKHSKHIEMEAMMSKL